MNDPKCKTCAGKHLSKKCPALRRNQRQYEPEDHFLDMKKIDLDAVKELLKAAAPIRHWGLLNKAMKAYLLLDPSNDFKSFLDLLDNLQLDIVVKAVAFTPRPRDLIMGLDGNTKTYLAKLAVSSDQAPYMLEEIEEFYAASEEDNLARLDNAGVLVGRGWLMCYCGSGDHPRNPECKSKPKYRQPPPCRNCGDEGHTTNVCQKTQASACPGCR